jgi:hypothetical protein
LAETVAVTRASSAWRTASRTGSVAAHRDVVRTAKGTRNDISVFMMGMGSAYLGDPRAGVLDRGNPDGGLTLPEADLAQW